MALEVLERVAPSNLIRTAPSKATVPTQRRRNLPTDVTLLLCIALSLWAREVLPFVLHKMMYGLRLFWPDPEGTLCHQGRNRAGALTDWGWPGGDNGGVGAPDGPR